jgi:uncharacterized protein YegP (UPF0339 family)
LYINKIKIETKLEKFVIKKQLRLYYINQFLIIYLCCFLLMGISCSKKTPATPTNIQKKTALPGVTPTPLPPTGPGTPVLNFPIESPHYSSAKTLTLSGICDSENTVILSGASTDSVDCYNHSYSFVLNQSEDGSFIYTLSQINKTNLESEKIYFTWIIDTQSPTKLSLLAPTDNEITDNQNLLTISGNCEESTKISIDGDLIGLTVCRNGNFVFVVNKEFDGIYNFILQQKDLAGNNSESTQLKWTLDTIAPPTPALQNPLANPFISGDTKLNLSGLCENNATVILRGGSSASTTCNNQGQFSFEIVQTTDGTFSFNLSQVDLAENTSAEQNFVWVRKSQIPPPPTILSPLTNPYYNNIGTLNLISSCEASNTVNLTEGSLGQLTRICPAEAPYQVNFEIAKSSDGEYQFQIGQFNEVTASTAASFTWIIDTIKPGVPNLVSPATNPYTAPGNLKLVGFCETSALVKLAGDSSQTTYCNSNNQFSFDILKTEDATYNFAITQQDLAGNISESLNFNWTRNSNSLAAPSITSPDDNPHWSNTSNLTLAGGCNPGYLVSLLITEDSEQFTQNCSQNSTYSFDVKKLTDGTFTLALKQSLNDAESPSNSVKWIRDTLAPTTLITNKNTLPTTNFSDTLTIEFTANESQVRFLCALDSAEFNTCTSPINLTLSSAQNGQHIWHVKAIDLAGNASEEDTFIWTQARYNTIALYHFDDPDPTNDSSFFSSKTNLNNNILLTNAIINTGKFKEAVTTSTASLLFVPHNASQNIASDATTFEAFIKPATLTLLKNQKMVIASKMGSAGNYGWEFGIICRNNSGCSSLSQSFSLYLNASPTLTAEPTLFQSSKFNGLSASNFKHVAFTLSAGILTFYFDGNSKGTATLGSGLTKTTANLQIGGSNNLMNKDDRDRNPNQKSDNKFLGSIDEIRWSQGLRYQTSTYTVPSESFTAD